MNAVTDLKHDYLVADIKLADWAARKSPSPRPKCRA